MDSSPHHGAYRNSRCNSCGCAPRIIDDLVLPIGDLISMYVWNWFLKYQRLGFGDPRLRFFPIVFCSCGGFVSRDLSPYISESEESPVSSRPSKPLAAPSSIQVGHPVWIPELCDASLIWRHGDATNPLITDQWTQEAIFNIPLSEGDCFVPTVAPSIDSHPIRAACTVCMKHVSV